MFLDHVTLNVNPLCQSRECMLFVIVYMLMNIIMNINVTEFLNQC